MAKNRIQLQKNKTNNLIQQQTRGVAELLLNKKDGMARIRMEQIIRDGVQAEAMEIVELFTELLIARSTLCEVTPSLADAPGDFREAVTSVAFASHRLDIPELRTVTNMFRGHFGEAVIDPITRCEGEYASSINTRLAQKLNMSVPEGRLILSQLQKVADDYRIDWKAPPEFEDLHNPSVLDPAMEHSYQPIPQAYAHSIPGFNPNFNDGPPPGPSAPPGGDFGPPPPPSYGSGGGGAGGGGGSYNIPGFVPGAPPGPGLYPNAGGGAGYDAQAPPPPPPSAAGGAYDSFPSAPPPPSDGFGGGDGGTVPRNVPPPPTEGGGDDLSSDLMSRFNNLKK